MRLPFPARGGAHYRLEGVTSKDFNLGPFPRARARITGVLHFLLSQPSQKSL